MRTTVHRGTETITRLALSILIAVGLGGAFAQDQQNAAGDPAGAVGDPNQTVIQLGEGETITVGEFDEEFERAMRSFAARQGVPYTEQTRALFDRFRADFLNQLATQEALLREAEARGITVTDDEVQEQLDLAREAAGGEEAFTSALQDLGYDSPDAYGEAVREGLIAQRVVDEFRSEIDLADEDVQQFYDENADRFGDQPLEEIRTQVEAEAVNDRLNQQFEELRSQYGIEIFPDRVTVDAEGLSRGDLEPNEPGDGADPEGDMGSDAPDAAGQDGDTNAGPDADPNAPAEDAAPEGGTDGQQDADDADQNDAEETDGEQN